MMASPSLLVVDDNGIFLQITVRFLSEYFANDIVIVGAASADEEALALTKAVRPCVVLLGLGGSLLRGRQVIPQLRSTLPHVIIIVMGTIDMNEYRQAVIAIGADAYIAKTALKTDLLPALRQCIWRC